MPGTIDYPLRTPRLALRPPTAADAEDLLVYRSIPEVCRYVPFEPMDAAEVRRRIDEVWTRHQLTDEGQHVTLAMELTDGEHAGRVVGDVVLMWHSREHGAGEVGWMLSPDFGGRGLASEAVRALLDVAFGVVGLHRVVARIDARNAASARLAERVGMRREAHLVENEWFKGEWTDELDYAVLAREWPAS